MSAHIHSAGSPLHSYNAVDNPLHTRCVQHAAYAPTHTHAPTHPPTHNQHATPTTHKHTHLSWAA
jgi:hypothetical protein